MALGMIKDTRLKIKFQGRLYGTLGEYYIYENWVFIYIIGNF